jgi:mRNA interferase YafQ
VLELKVTRQFRRDYKREKANKSIGEFESQLLQIIKRLQENKPLEPRHRLHRLRGSYQGFLECHVKPDLLLIFRISDELELVRLGSHSELFG